VTITSTTVRTKAADIRVIESAGDRLPIVMIHGSGSSKAVFAKQFDDPLFTGHRMVALDLPGHGESSDARVPAENYLIRGFAVTVGEVLDQLGIDHAVIFGWSLGGHIAIELMGWHPAVAGVMASGAPPISRGPLGILRGFQIHRDVFLASKPQFTAADAERFLNICYDGQGTPEFLESIKRADGQARKILFSGMMRGDGADQRRTVQEAWVPVAIVNGEHEPFARLGYVSGVSSDSLWEGQAHVIEGTGHALFWTNPEKFNPLLARFVKDVEAAEAARLARGPERRMAHGS
jgi:pimeloyl-ACP methyl ester carboxylesterase